MTIIFFTAIVAEIFLVLLSFITCQLIQFNYFQLHDEMRRNRVPDWLRKVAKVIIFVFWASVWFSALVVILINLLPVIFVSWTWICPQVVVFNVSYLFNVEKINSTYENQIPSIALRDMTYEQAHSLSYDKVIDNMSKFEVFSKLVILFLAFSSFISYFLFISVLLCTYKCAGIRHWCIKTIKGKSDELYKPLDPFSMTDPKEISTKLDLPESLYFNFLLLLNIVLWMACFCLFWTAHFDKPAYYDVKVKEWLEKVGFIFYMYSLLCTIVSCFIFSKIAYSVNQRCLKLYDKFENHTKQDGDEDVDGLHRLIEQDNKFTKMAQETVYWFEFWFTIHWVFYTVTSFLSIGLVFDMLVKYTQAELKAPLDNAIGFSWKELVVVSLFTLQHCFLFLYPCFKAAAVTVSREKLIKKVNSHSDPNHPLKDERKQLYIQHLKNKKFGFRISFFCARLRFGFNVAYISIFIGLSGVLLKLTDLF